MTTHTTISYFTAMQSVVQARQTLSDCYYLDAADMPSDEDAATLEACRLSVIQDLKAALHSLRA